MPHIKIVIREKKDNTPAFENLSESDTVWVEPDGFVILEGGMESGKTSVALSFKLPDGKTAIAETSAEIFNGMAVALRGAEQRFVDNKK